MARTFGHGTNGQPSSQNKARFATKRALRLGPHAFFIAKEIEEEFGYKIKARWERDARKNLRYY